MLFYCSSVAISPIYRQLCCTSELSQHQRLCVHSLCTVLWARLLYRYFTGSYSHLSQFWNWPVCVHVYSRTPYFGLSFTCYNDEWYRVSSQSQILSHSMRLLAWGKTAYCAQRHTSFISILYFYFVSWKSVALKYKLCGSVTSIMWLAVP